MTMTFDGDRVDQRVSTRVITQSSTMPRRACSPCCCRPCTRAAQPLLLLPPGIWAIMPLIPGLSNSPSPNPHYHPPSDGASAPFEADENGVGSSPFLSLSGCLSASSHQPCCCRTRAPPRPCLSFLGAHSSCCASRCAAADAAAALTPLRCQSFQSCRILLSYSPPLE